MDTSRFWAEATVLAGRIAERTRLNPRFVGGDVGQVKADMIQEGLMGAASWLSTHADFVERSDLNDCRRVFNPVIKCAMLDYLRLVNRENGHELSASGWLENMGEDDDEADEEEVDEEIAATVEIEHEEEDTPEEIIEDHETLALKTAITCLNKEMQAVVLLHNDGLSFRKIAERMNFSRERPRQLYHKHMRRLRGKIQTTDAEPELPLDCGSQEPETLLFSSQDEKIQELHFRKKSTRGNISQSTRAMRQAARGEGGQLSLFL